MKQKITTDLSKLTNVDEKILDKIFELTKLVISSKVYESTLAYKDITEIDLIFGDLLIKNDNGVVKTKFIPSPDLELDLKGVNAGDQPTLKKALEKSLIAKLIDLYKEIL